MFVVAVKRAMRDNLPSFNEEPDLNWGPLETTAYYLFCNRFGGVYTDFPARQGQSEDFLSFIDNYYDESYTKQEDPKVEEPVKKQGVDLKQFIPDRQPVSTEGSTEARRAQNSVINENVGIKPLPNLDAQKAEENANKPSEAVSKDSTEKESSAGQANDQGNANKPDDNGSDAATKETNSQPRKAETAEKPKNTQAAKSKPQNSNLSTMKIKVR